MWVPSFTPDGVTQTTPTPDPYTTNIAFGGADMCTAWITLSTTGRLIKRQWAEAGLKLHFNG